MDELKAPIVADVSVVVASAISTGEVKPASLDFCHFTTDPVSPLKVRSAGELREQIVCGEATVPPTEAGSTVISTDADRMRIWTRRRYRPYHPGAGKEHQHAIHRLLLRFGPG